MTEVKRGPGRPKKVAKKVEEKATIALPPIKMIARTISKTGGATPDGGMPITEFEPYLISYMDLGYKLHTFETIESTPNEVTVWVILTL